MESRPLRMLSGVEIVNRGRNVSDCILPEVGQKEVNLNGSWLETKQVQTAIEARKALVAVERIDKVGALSHAEWNEQLKLAEVTQQVGGHWQYIGHIVNGTFFLLPEEALYLMETNCLLLKHNQVTVSVQKAYSLLLDEHMTLTQYKVYASLSRVGYKVFRHDKSKSDDKKKKLSNSHKENNTNSNVENVPDMHLTDSEKSDIKPNGNSCKITATQADLVIDKVNEYESDVLLLNDSNNESLKIPTSVDPSNDSQIAKSKDFNGNEKATQSENVSKQTGSTPKDILSIDKYGVIRSVTVPEMDSTSTSSDLRVKQTDSVQGKNPEENKPKKSLNIYQIMKQKLKNRKIPPADPKTSQDIFKNMPDCFNKQVVTVKVPSEEYLPRNIFLNNTSYVLNLQELKQSKRRSKSTSTVSVENRAMYRTIANSSESETAAVPTPDLPQILPNTPLFEQPFQFFPSWRSRFNPLPRYQFNQHPFFYRMMHFMPQSFTTNRPRIFTGFMDQRKRQYDVKEDHLLTIKNFANRLKQFHRPAYNSVRSLQGLVARFNEIYNAKIRITHNFDVMDDSDVETIELDDDDVEAKKPRLDNETYEKYFASVKALAAKLKNLERKSQPISKQKKAFCNLLDNFNETFNTEFQLDSKGALVDKKLVILDSSSDSDVVATDDVPNRKKRLHSDNCEGQSKRRKVLNPLNILRKVNEGASTSKSVKNVSEDPVENNTDLLKYFNKEWLPNNDDFGKATPCPKTNAFHLWRDSQELYDFISWVDLKTWVDLKLTFCSQYMEAVSEFNNDLSTHSRDMSTDSSSLKPILAQEPSGDWATSLEKLRIIKTNTEVQETCLTVDFEVYNRDVQNFRKTDPPKPHFRVVCVDAHSNFPSGAEVRSLHSRYDDNITTVFAVVDVGSIVYLQINPKDLPVYVGND